MSLSDIFTPSVVISLAISLLLIGLLGLYVSNKLNEQNHKLNTMFDLVSTLANELQMVRSQPPVGSPSIGGGRMYEKPEVANTNHLVNMIDVSDDSDSSGDDESDGDSDGDGDGDDENDGNDEEDSDDGSDDGDDEESDGDSDGDDEGENDARSDKAIVVSESLDDALFEELANLDDIISEETKVERVKTPETTTTTTPTPANTSSVKNLNVVFDYKKASLGKLREIVEQKGLSSDTSKLKKQELLKMLEID